MMALAEQKAKAAAMRESARRQPVDMLAVLEEAKSFVSRHSEDWYYSGQELLGLIEGAIAAQKLLDKR